MKNIKNIIFVLAGVLLLTFMSCEKLTDVNIDPNNPTSVPAENLLTAAQFNLANTMWSRGLNGEWSMLMVQHWAQNEYAEESRYAVDGNNFNAQWVEIFADVLRELKTTDELVSANEGLPANVKANQKAIISILEVYSYHHLTDLYVDIPFSEALKAEFPNPAYDSQSSIYAGLVDQLQGAVGSIDPGAASFDTGDVIYGGNAALWEKFGNSLLLRIAMRMSDVDQGTASTVINAIDASKLILSNGENALFNFSSTASISNPLYVDNIVNNRDDFCVSDVLVDQLVLMGDPRLDVYADVTVNGTYEGMPYGLPDADAFALKPTTSRPGPTTRAATAPAILMDYAEVSFLLAEAYQRGILSGAAGQAYDDGVAASMDFWGINDAAALTAYLTANPYDAANWKQSIGMQKWLAFYMNGTQAWAEWRRLDFPALAAPAAATITSIPVRLPYPISEQTNNEASLNAVTGGDPNDMSSKMWWDVN